MTTIYDFEVKQINGEMKTLNEYKGKILLIVNTASKCGFTPQYKGLQELYEKYKDKGFEILAFPCNQFMNQEPGTNDEIQSFCQLNYGVTFEVFSKIDVNGEQADPLFNYLSDKARGAFGTKGIKWNFTKFLIDRDGQVIKRFSPQTKPNEIVPFIENYL